MDRSSPHDGRPLAQATGGNGLDCPFHYGEALHAARLQGLCAGKAGPKHRANGAELRYYDCTRRCCDEMDALFVVAENPGHPREPGGSGEKDCMTPQSPEVCVCSAGQKFDPSRSVRALCLYLAFASAASSVVRFSLRFGEIDAPTIASHGRCRWFFSGKL